MGSIEIYEVGGNVLAGIKSSYERSSACVWVAGNVSSCLV